jgi:formylglycine-generating enzyme required for sulfatase activity
MKTIPITLASFLLVCSSVMAQDADTSASPQTEEESTQAEGEDERSVRRLGDMVGSGSSEFSMDIPTIAAPAIDPATLPDVTLPDPQQDEALQSLLRRQAFSPNDPEVASELTALMDQVEADARAALAAGNLTQAQRLTEVLREIEPNRAVIAQVAGEINRRSTIASTLTAASAALEAGSLIGPEGENASALFQQVLALDPGNAEAQAGLETVFAAMMERAVGQAQELDFEAAEATLADALSVLDDRAAVDETRGRIESFREGYLADLDDEALQSIEAGNFDEAEGAITRLLALGYPRDRIEDLQALLTDARLYGSLDPGQIFADEMASVLRPGPDLVVMPAGSFMMGSPDGEEGRFDNEGPVHRVTFERGFAISRTEITVADFELFVNATGYRTDAERVGESRVYDPRTGRMDVEPGITWRDDYVGEAATPGLPVVHVSWNDARAYVNWLGRETGRSYRLPSEAEFEYATRAGSQTPYWWGEGSPEDETENVTGDRDTSPTNANWNVAFRRYSDGFWGPAPVASLRANPFGLFDMSGNVMEWVEDCWHDSFVRAPDDGRSWMNPGCDRHVIKGGAWSSTPAMTRSAFRLQGTADTTDMRVGFRVARDL